MTLRLLCLVVAMLTAGLWSGGGLRAENRLLFGSSVLSSGDSVASLNLTLQNDVAVSGLLLGLQFDTKLRIDSVQALGRGLGFSVKDFNNTKSGQGIFLAFDQNGASLSPDSGQVFKIWFTVRDSVFSLHYLVDFGETEIANNNLQLISHSTLGGLITRGFTRGDVNDDGRITIGDAVFLIQYIFAGGPPPTPVSDGDVDCNNKVAITDIVYIINFIFVGGGTPCLK